MIIQWKLQFSCFGTMLKQMRERRMHRIEIPLSDSISFKISINRGKLLPLLMWIEGMLIAITPLMAHSSAACSAALRNGRFSNGSFDHWRVSGNAWGVTTRSRGNAIGRYHIESLQGGEQATGIVRSSPFMAGDSSLCFLLNGYPGGVKTGYNLVQLRDAGTRQVIRSIKPPGSDNFSLVVWNLRSLGKRRVYLEAIDGAHGSGYSWLGMDDIHQDFDYAKPEIPASGIEVQQESFGIQICTRKLLLLYDQRAGRITRLCCDLTGRAANYGMNLFSDTAGMGAEGSLRTILPVHAHLLHVRGGVRLIIGPFNGGVSSFANHNSQNKSSEHFARVSVPSQDISYHETDTITVTANSSIITIDRSFQLLKPVHQAFGVFQVHFSPDLGLSRVLFAGRKGSVPGDGAGPLLLHSYTLSIAGAVDKTDEDRCIVFSFGAVHGIHVVTHAGFDGPSGMLGEDMLPLSELHDGSWFQQRVTVEPGWNDVAPKIQKLKEAVSDFDPMAERFLYWTSVIGTIRRFPHDILLQRTAARLAQGMPNWMRDAYNSCWIRDVAHGWMSSSLVCGRSVLSVLRDEVEAFASYSDQRGWTPTGIDRNGKPVYGNEDSMSYLIEMAYLYVSRTGDRNFLKKEMPELERAGNAIIGLEGSEGLPIVRRDGDTWPDLGQIKGEQTYLAAICFMGLHRLAILLRYLDSPAAALKYDGAARRIQTAANKSDREGGLWNPTLGAFIGWRTPAGKDAPPETSGNLVSIGSGMCVEPERIASIFHYLDKHKQFIYKTGLCPDAYTAQPETNMLQQWLPWIAGWDILDRTRYGDPQGARYVFKQFMRDYHLSEIPFREAAGAGQIERNDGNSGRIWDSWGLLMAIYGGQFGVELSPGHLRIDPRPVLGTGRKVENLPWRNYRYDLLVKGEGIPVAVTHNGRSVGSLVLPPESGEYVIQLGSRMKTPLLTNASPDVQLKQAEERKGRLSLTVLPVDAGETLTITYPGQTACVKGLMRNDTVSHELNRLIVTFGVGQGVRHLLFYSCPYR